MKDTTMDAIAALQSGREAARVDAGMCDISKHAPVRKALESLVAVLCDPEGKCCISGSDEDRKIVDSGLSTIFEAINVPEICKTGCEHYDVYGDCDLEQANSKIASLTAELAAAKATLKNTQEIVRKYEDRYFAVKDFESWMFKNVDIKEENLTT